MKVQKIIAYRSDDGCIWEDEKGAIEQNIDNLMSEMSLNHESHGKNKDEVLLFFKQNKAGIRYILNNIDKLD